MKKATLTMIILLATTSIFAQWKKQYFVDDFDFYYFLEPFIDSSILSTPTKEEVLNYLSYLKKDLKL